MDIKLLPKEYQAGPTVSRGFKLPALKFSRPKFDFFKPETNLWLFLAVGLLILSILIYLGLVIYKSSLQRAEIILADQIKEKESKRDLEFEKGLIKLEKNIQDVKKLLEIHIYPSRLFKMLEELTLVKVQWTQFGADLSESKISPRGKAYTYSDLAKQIVVLENDPRIQKVETSRIVLGETGGVDFNMVLKFVPELLKYEK